MIEDPVNFPHYRHNKPDFCVFSLINMFPEGMPWENDNSGGKREPNGKMVFVIQLKCLDHLRMVNLLDEAKERDTWLPYWGDTAFTVLMPLQRVEKKDKWTSRELNNYTGCVQAHGSVKLSYGAATITGLFDPDKKYNLQSLPDKINSEN